MTASREILLEAQKPWAVGFLRLPGGYQPYAVSLRDIERDTAWARQVFEWMGLERGKPVHLIGAGSDNEILWPYENALIGMKIPFGVAEPAQIDAPRSDMFLRRFPLQALIGLSGGVVAGLCALGRNLESLLGHCVVAALPDACAALRDADVAHWRMIPIGPINAFSPPGDAGARYDTSEWLVEEDGGELLLTSRAPRACPFVRLRTGVRGRLEAQASGEPRIVTAL